MEIKMTAMPMAVIAKVHIKKNQTVHKDDALVEIEAKKGNKTLKAPMDGTITEIYCHEGDQPKAGDMLMNIEAIQADDIIETPAVLSNGTVGKIHIHAGDTLQLNNAIMEVETKKGNRPLKATKAGIVQEIYIHEGDVLSLNQALFKIKECAVTEESTTVNEVHTPLLIIGGGTGGYVAAIHASKHHLKTTLIEQKRLGGTCLNVGCIPTKSLIASSHAYEAIVNASTFGIDLQGQATPNLAKMVERKDQVVNQLVGGIDYLMKKNDVDVIYGQAHFIDDSHVQVDQTIYTFDDCIIATGSKVFKPNIPGIDLPGILDSTKALDLKDLPRSLTIVGAGVIGLEFAFMYAKLGVEVTVIEFADRPLAMLEGDIIDQLMTFIDKEKITLVTSAKVTSFNESIHHQLITTYEKDGQTYYQVSDKVLVAIGRAPQMDGLALDLTHVQVERGILVDDHMRTNVPHLYAVGDVNNLIQLAHAASHQGIIAVNNILGHDEAFDIDLVPSVIFTSPEIATVGLTPTKATARGIAYKKGIFHFSSNGKALAQNEGEGFIQLLCDDKQHLIGASVIGPDASTLIATLTLAITNKLTVDDVTSTIFAHPTTAEVIHEAALDLGLGAYHE